MTPVVSVRPVPLGAGLRVRATAPTVGDDLPVIVFSHGFGWSMDGYAPLADHWAAAGFAVVQPTHLDSRTLALAPDDPRTPGIWRSRADDLIRVLDHLDLVEAALATSLDRTRVAVAGHSWGAQTASMLLGATALGEDRTDPRVQAGVLLAVPGRGGADLSPFAAEHFPFMTPVFATMRTPALVVAGDKDQSALTGRGPDWFTDAYHDSPAPKALLTLHGGEHSLGGIVGVTVTETTDENPRRVATVQQVTTDYLRHTLAGRPWSPEQPADGRIEVSH
jgi:predicted dienelactone hydrolase